MSRPLSTAFGLVFLAVALRLFFDDPTKFLNLAALTASGEAGLAFLAYAIHPRFVTVFLMKGKTLDDEP